MASTDADGWAGLAAEVIGLSISKAIASRGVCYIMLTGGNTAEQLYNYWAVSSALPLGHIRLLFGDERSVPPDHDDSNYALAMRTLLVNGLPSSCEITRMEAECPDRDAVARRYEQLIPEEVDVLLLGMGMDGHVASIFPYDAALQPGSRSVLPVTGPTSPRERLTITPRVIAHARSVFLLATGAEKGQVLAEALKSPEDYMSLPVRLTLGGTWLLDDEAARQVSGSQKILKGS
jgi:6-phosphogluconolactonase